jgi:hypothetical protein
MRRYGSRGFLQPGSVSLNDVEANKMEGTYSDDGDVLDMVLEA